MNTPIYDAMLVEQFRRELDQLPSFQDTPPRRWNALVTAVVLAVPCVAFWAAIVWAVTR